MKDLKIKVKLDDGAYMPTQAHDTDAGYDLRSPIDATVPCYSDGVLIPTGVHMAIPEGYYGRIASKSGLNCKHGVTSEGVIDSGYTGEICVKMYNATGHAYPIKKGDKITQIILERCYTADLEEVDSLDATERGDGGFGSTGR